MPLLFYIQQKVPLILSYATIGIHMYGFLLNKIKGGGYKVYIHGIWYIHSMILFFQVQECRTIPWHHCTTKVRFHCTMTLSIEHRLDDWNSDVSECVKDSREERKVTNKFPPIKPRIEDNSITTTADINIKLISLIK